jgi:hypothetical protein
VKMQLQQRMLVVALVALALGGIVAWPQGAAQAARTRVATPYLYRPYYGSASIISRSVSLFDHDEPWYANDGKFVRYDGTTYSGSAVTNCQPHISCYDGHNGYDINMVFEPVVSAAGGTVIRAGWFNAMNHLDGGGLWVAIDHGVNPGNGVDYVTMYCHLSAVLVSVGQKVGTQWQIGTSGSTGSATGPHLHFTAFQMPNWEPMDPFGWTGAGDDPNPTPDYYLWVGNPASTTQSPCLGCDNGQPHQGAVVVDDTTAGFAATGTWHMANGAGMIDGGMRWTSTSTGGATATATWQPTIPTTGTYEVGVYIDPANASSQWAPYTITSLDANGKSLTTTVHIDQEHVGTFQNAYGTVNTGPQWVGLGTYTFGAGTGGYVTVSNATGEVGAQLGVDALEFVPVAGGNAPQPPPQGAPTATPVPPTATPVAPTPTMPPVIIPSRGHRHP